MTAKEYLEQYQSAEIERKELGERILRLRSQRESITPKYEIDCGGNPNINKDKIPAITEMIIEEEIRQGHRVKELLSLQSEIQSVISRVPDNTCRSLLLMRYIGNKTFEKIADTMNYSYFHVVRRLHPKALEYVDGILEF